MKRNVYRSLLWFSLVCGALVPSCATVDSGVQAYKSHDYATALQEFKKDGSASAHYTLGLMYYKGEGVREDRREAIRWFRKAAEQGDAKAQFSMGVMYYKGIGIDQDKREAARWMRRAAEQELPQAQFDLGLMYSRGEGVMEDRAEAVTWFRRAAAKGYVKAEKVLEFWGEER